MEEEQDIELSEGIKSINKKLKKPVLKSDEGWNKY